MYNSKSCDNSKIMVRDDDGDDNNELLLICWYNRHKANYREREREEET